MGIKNFKLISIKSKVNIVSMRKNTKKNGAPYRPQTNRLSTYQSYFLKRELFTPACSHFLIVGLRNDIGRAVKTTNETTSIKSVVK